MANIYTKTGDKGQTGLYGGERVWKDSLKVEAYGTIDEANSAMGLAHALSSHPTVRTSLHQIQKRLFTLGAELASDHRGEALLQNKIGEEDIRYLENCIDWCISIVGEQHQFVIPGENPVSSVLHMARTIVRRAERTMIRLSKEESLREELIRYVNRLSDTLYAFARVEEHEENIRQIIRKVLQKIEDLPLESQKGDLVSGLNLDVAKQLASYAEEKATSMGLNIVIAVVCAGGNLILLHRMEDSLLVSIDVAIGKAYTANSLKMTTSKLSTLVQPSQPLYGIENTNPKIVSIGGGIPYIYEGKVIGGVGVSGGTPEQDQEIVNYAMERLMGGQSHL